jgi:hypothetical protein
VVVLRQVGGLGWVTVPQCVMHVMHFVMLVAATTVAPPSTTLPTTITPTSSTTAAAAAATTSTRIMRTKHVCHCQPALISLIHLPNLVGRHRMGVAPSKLDRVQGPGRRRLCNIDRVPGRLRHLHIILHLPSLQIGVVDAYQRPALSHRCARPAFVPIVGIPESPGVKRVASVALKEVVGRQDDATSPGRNVPS